MAHFVYNQQFIVTTLVILLCVQVTQGKGPPGKPPTAISTTTVSLVHSLPTSIPLTVERASSSQVASTNLAEVILSDAVVSSPARAILSGVALPSSASLSTGPGGDLSNANLDPMGYRPACHNFSVGNMENQQFYSPNFPSNYPNNTDCIKKIEALPGHLLRLDFRGTFHIEPSDDCRYDYLEVRDGAHAHSSLIGTYCGHNHPPMITSSDRYLWLRFHSDENIEYSGFHAIYQNMPRPQSSPELKSCEMSVSGVEGWVNSTAIDEERVRHSHNYSVPLDCMWIIRVAKGWKITLTFLTFSLDTPNDCESNFVDVFFSKTDIQEKYKNFWKFCGSIAESVSSNSSILFVRMYLEARAINKTIINGLFTAFREKPAEAGCVANTELDCEDNTCISKTLRCNGRNNCRYLWDEHGCSNKKASWLNKEHIIIILVVFTFILSGMCFAFIFNCVRKLLRDHHIMKEHVRQSREGRLDELGLGSGGCMGGEGITTLGNAVSLGAIPGGSSSGSSPRNLKLRAAVAAMTRFSSEPPRTPTDEDDPARGCYVPAAAGDGGALPPGLLDKPRYNGDAIIFRDVLNNSPSVEMCDSECQTRDSLFQDSIPPPPPAPRYAQPPRVPPSQISNNNPRFSTFGRSASTAPLKELNRPEEIKPPHRFRAEAVIEMQQQQQQQQQQQAAAAAAARQQGGGGGVGRPYSSSAESTKSAPDVIVTH